MKIVYSPNFERDLRNINDKKLLSRVAEKVKLIEAAETLQEIGQVKKLDGYEHAFRIRIGDYRLGFLLDNGTVILGRFLHRKDIYRGFP